MCRNTGLFLAHTTRRFGRYVTTALVLAARLVGRGALEHGCFLLANLLLATFFFFLNLLSLLVQKPSRCLINWIRYHDEIYVE